MTISDSPSSPTYDSQAVQQILQIAIARQSSQGELSREQLLEVADELNISRADLLAAERDWQEQQREQEQRQAFAAYRWRILKRQAGQFLIVNTFLVILDFTSSGMLGWSLYILLFWGMVLCLQIWRFAQTDSDEYQRAFQSWQRKQQLKQSAKLVWTTVWQRLTSS